LKAIEDALEVHYDSGEAGSMSVIAKWTKPFQFWKGIGRQIKKIVVERAAQHNI